MKVINIRQAPEYAEQAIAFFQNKWATDDSMMVYEDCITRSLVTSSPLPQWYLLMNDQQIIGGAGVITNDFISCVDLWPWLCALFIEEPYRGQRLSEFLIDVIKQDIAKLGFSKLYLSTSHEGLYEKYGFTYVAKGYHPWGEQSRVYEIVL